MKLLSFKLTIRQFFIVTFAVSWIIWIPLAVSHLASSHFIPEGISNIIRLLGVLVPAVVAIIFSARSGEGNGIGPILGRLAIWQVRWQWWAAAALIQPVILILVALAYNAFGAGPKLPFNSQISFVELLVQVILLAIATLGEEIGWRGYVLPLLFEKQSAFRASLLLGGIWSSWHIPFWLLQDSFDQYGPGYMFLNFLMIVPMSVYITWFFQHTRGSILLAAVFHLTFNLINVLIVPVTSLITPYILFIILQWLIAGWVVLGDQAIFRPSKPVSLEGERVGGDAL